LEVVLHRLWEGCFGRRRMTTKMTETSRDDEHEEDVVTRSMFEMLCKGKPSSLLSTACPKRRSSATAVARASGADPSWRNNHRWGEDGGNDRTGHASVMTTTTNDCHTYNDETTRTTI